MNKVSAKKKSQIRRQKRVRAKVFGTEDRPRLSVFKSNKEVYAQIINDEKGQTLVSASSREMKKKSKESPAAFVGKSIAEKAKKEGVEKVVFDRSGYKYRGNVKELADAARDEGLVF